uniref:Sarcoglycan zeta n=1 Tax=Steinernema glaseri TaxID=37863 RepID=A0A1I8AW42_9BILA
MATRYNHTPYGLPPRGYPEEAVWSRSAYDVQKQPLGYPTSMRESSQPLTTVVHSNMKPTSDSNIYKVGIYGWRKRCLYVFIVALTVIIVINLALTIWVMSVLDISLNGMGALKITDDGIQVKGKAQFEEPVQFSQLSTANERDEALVIDSPLGVSVQARNQTGYRTAGLDLGIDGKATAVCDRFEVLESPTRDILIDAAQDVEILSSAGEIQIQSLLDLSLNSKQGEIRLDSGNILMSGLARSDGRGAAQYQLCICQSGRVFLAAERADCRADRSICM